ncbi:hypothetical protein D9M69_704440 [compost metagenome]
MEAIRWATSLQNRPLSNRRIGVMRMPSLNISLAATSKEPGTLPPRSDQWPFDWLKAMILPSTKIGRISRTSLKWVPPA